ncbi:hypothetical protein CspeluHIS016_0211720 [Cutaneotrichosporon spelunceum]|uniref:Uncharacterized protein n=1 Tax=Cutaneotrichosporon spelunceum TaxID=1672016 RepID=A0AAD3TTD2_9TREE|nr:hypothetical protein CspeluHIS016_0211720 [Cutaneotrichosporon spelunceum]
MRLSTAALIAFVGPALAVPLDSVFAHGRYLASLNVVTRQLVTRQAAYPPEWWGTCLSDCNPIAEQLDSTCGPEFRNTRRAASACAAQCTGDYKTKLDVCSACLGKLNDTQAIANGKEEVSFWITYMSDYCPGVENPPPGTNPPTTNPPGTKEPEPMCPQCESIYTRVMMACNTSSPDTCSGLCGDLDAINSCVTCYGSIDGYNAFRSYAGDAQWYCTTDGGQGCTRMIGTAAQLCGESQTHCSDICTGDNWTDIKKCEGAAPSSDLTGSQAQTIMDGIGAFNKFCEKEPPVVTKPGCGKECDAIRATYGDLCRDKEATKCRGMCTPDNLGAFEACNSCAQGVNSTYTDDTKTSISASLTTLNAWCTKVDTKPIDDPEVVSTIPDPTSVETVEVVPEDDNTSTDQENTGTITNPFANSSSSNSNTESKGIPTWAIGVAAAGGALVLAAVAGAVIAYNYQCDHDHRRLRRRRKKNKKKDDDEKPHKPHEEQPPQQEPQVIGYMVPTERPPSEGYFAGLSSPPLSTPLSAPVSMAHTPMSQGSVSLPQSPPAVSPPGSPPPTGYPYPQQQFGQPQYDQQYGQHYAPFPPHQGGQQY